MFFFVLKKFVLRKKSTEDKKQVILYSMQIVRDFTYNCTTYYGDYYCAYRNSVNNAFLRLFRYVRTDRTMTIRI